MADRMISLSELFVIPIDKRALSCRNGRVRKSSNPNTLNKFIYFSILIEINQLSIALKKKSQKF